ncbi:glycosyltransferase family 39 protein [Planotetraspora kaengkrachanensis]|uniref:Glycosyl transferase n=1 Tax=Planotetraspora kaengkrachanensis TaxID=575193 RepID=A0A8J3PV05_9ACTN|nr:glycosyltransferase family 39 protein [Planotetraspora kaengkrachanensis]GIG81555.1 glycosyl transferase [Planotetraspora kaengkrachanensis]
MTGTARWARPAMWGVLALAAVLYTWALGRNGYANEYYAAAVYSGTRSWKAFFFGALDAGSFITVDKPPLALWVMGLSARIFGFGTWSMLLPQAVAGVASVAVVHSAVLRSLRGTQARVAALIAALVMTLTPITVAITRDNNPDTILVLLLVTAAWFCLEAVRRDRLRPLLLAAAFAGLAFNAKMLQAYLAVPALCLAYLCVAGGGLARRVRHLLAAGAVLAVCSVWWMVVVDLWPASSRPYIGGSTDNSVLDLVVGYNGIGRIVGRGAEAGNVPGAIAGEAGGWGGFGGFGGRSGAGRLFNDSMAGQISWLLPFAALALVAGLMLASRRSPAQAALVLWGSWLVVHFAVFSFSHGTFHPYYTTAMAPAVSALTGIGAVLLWRAQRESPVWRWVLPTGVAVTGGWSFVVLRRTPDFVPWLPWAVAAATAVAVIGLVAVSRRILLIRPGRRRLLVATSLAGLFACLAGPASYALTPLTVTVRGGDPTAGPASERRAFWPGATRSQGVLARALSPWTRRNASVAEGMIDYLERNQGGATWLLAVGQAHSASSIILSTGRPVLAMGGFSGRDPAMTLDKLKEYASEGLLKYVLVGDRLTPRLPGRGRGGGMSADLTDWVTGSGTRVDPAEYGGTAGGTLYRLG